MAFEAGDIVSWCFDRETNLFLEPCVIEEKLISGHYLIFDLTSDSNAACFYLAYEHELEYFEVEF